METKVKFDYDAHSAIVQWMRSNGVLTLEIDGLKIHLGPAPAVPLQPTEEQRQSEDMHRRRRELDILFSATSMRPKQNVP
jgi:hypothetical protein